MPRLAYILALALVVLLGSVGGASAQMRDRYLDDPYIAAKLTLGFGGSATMSTERGNVTYEASQSLGASFGLAGQYLYPLHPYFSIGGLFGFQSWRTTGDGDGGRNLVFDLAVLPQGRYVLLPGRLELNATLPIGLALDMLNEYDSRNAFLARATGAVASGMLEGNTAVGLVVGFLLGARYQLLESVGLLAEMGYIFRTVGHTLTPSVAVDGLARIDESVDIGVSWGQFVMSFGAYF
jgi:hypothetical protein